MPNMVDTAHTVLDEAMARDLLPMRALDAHKWEVGGVVVVAGSPSYPGAALLTSRSAGRAGAGIVHLATSRNVIGSIAAGIPEVAFIPLPETESSSGARKAVESIREVLPRASAMVVGPGLGADTASDTLLATLFGFGGKSEQARGRMGFGSEAQETTASGTGTDSIFADSDISVVIDADGLNWLARQDAWWERLPVQRVVLTPHPGEMARLLDRPVEDIVADPIGIAREAARTWQQVVLLKGGQAVVSNGETTILADLAAGSLATAGSGDVLAGTVGGVLAQTHSPFDAAVLAVYVGPRAALRMEDRFGVLGVVATDLPDAIATELALLAN
jgi:NAD(P)H-hydrate repair Nnr-like enzyme with NAD(P)H-hydrate dehydratase domain